MIELLEIYQIQSIFYSRTNCNLVLRSKVYIAVYLMDSDGKRINIFLKYRIKYI